MIFVACSGFPVPVSRYWDDFLAVEINETELGIPGEGTLRRWVREAPSGFAFTLLAPSKIAESGFAVTPENQEAVTQIVSVGQHLSAHAVVFLASEEWKPSKVAKSALRAWLENLPEGFPTPVLDLPSWKPSQVTSAIGDLPAVIAADPLTTLPTDRGPLEYLRLGGPSGYRSRYDESALVKVAKRCQASLASTVFCVFRNIDRHTNASSLRKLLEDG